MAKHHPTKRQAIASRKAASTRARKISPSTLSDNAFRLSVVAVATGAAVVHAYLFKDSSVLGSFVASIGGAVFASLGRGTK